MKGHHAGALSAGAFTGSPAAILAIWLLENYVLHEPLTAIVAGAVGSVVTTFAAGVAVAWGRLFGGRSNGDAV